MCRINSLTFSTFNGLLDKDDPERHQPEKLEEKTKTIVSWKPREETVLMLNVCKMVTKNISIRFEDMKIICDPNDRCFGGVKEADN